LDQFSSSGCPRKRSIDYLIIPPHVGVKCRFGGAVRLDLSSERIKYFPPRRSDSVEESDAL
jgi:hypothetical protein